MYAIICGTDAFGKKLLEGLLKKGHDVVAIEKNEEIAHEVHAETNAVVINGDPTSITILEQAGISKADVFIANMPTDVENLALCIIAKKYGLPYVTANVHDPAYLDAFKITGVDKTLAAVDTLYEEIINVIESPSIKKSVALNNHKLLVIDSSVNPKIVGKRPGEIESENPGLNVLATIKEDVSMNRQSKILEHSLVLLLIDKKREEKIRRMFKK